jgi:hypothetical protein
MKHLKTTTETHLKQNMARRKRLGVVKNATPRRLEELSGEW